MARSAPSGGRNHIPALDGLRGVAVAAVVLYHLGYLTGGFLGVDLFFVLSGYLITTVIVTEWVREGEISLPAFWARRARRLLPAAFVVLAAVAVYGAVAATAIDRGPIRADGLAALFYVGNWHQILTGTNYFDVFRSKSPLEHMWSLSVEEQFYLVWPLIVAATLGRRSRRGSINRGLNRLFVVSLVCAAASVATMLLLFAHSHSVDRVYYGTDTRAGAILMGCALAAYHQRWGRAMKVRTAQVLDLVSILFLGAIALTWVLADGTSAWLYQGGLTATGLMVCVLMAALVTPTPGLLGAILSIRPLRFLGRISYGVYLWHWPVIVAMTRGRTHIEDDVVLDLARVAVTLLFAVLSAFLVELPIRRGAFKGRMGLTVAMTGAIACAMVLIASTTASTNPLSAEAAFARAHPGQLVVATDPVTTAPVVTTPRPPTSTLVVGDSGAFYVGAGMARVASDFNRTIINRGTVGCGVARGDGRLRLPDGRILVDTKGCDQYLARWQGYLDQYKPKQVVLMLADVGGGDRFVQGHWIGDCNPQFDAFFRFEIAQGIHLLQSGGATVTITTIPDIVDDESSGDSRLLDCRNAALQAGAASQGANVVDFRHWACPTASRCVSHFEGANLRPDRVHFIGPGADIAASWLLGQIKA